MRKCYVYDMWHVFMFIDLFDLLCKCVENLNEIIENHLDID